MKVRILKGESAGQVLDLPADFAMRLLILNEVDRILESESGLTVVHTQVYDAAVLKQAEDTSKNRRG